MRLIRWAWKISAIESVQLKWRPKRFQNSQKNLHSIIHEDSRRKSKTKTAISRSKRNEKSSFDSENVSFSEIYPRNMSNRQIKIFDFFWSDFVVKMFPSSKVVFQNAKWKSEFFVFVFTFYTTFWPNFWREIDWDHLFLIWSWIDAAKPDLVSGQIFDNNKTILKRFLKTISSPDRFRRRCLGSKCMFLDQFCLTDPVSLKDQRYWVSAAQMKDKTVSK